MRQLPMGVGVVLLFGLACMGAEPTEGLAPSVREVPPATVGLDPFVGRWEALTEQDGQTVIFTPCDRENHFVEIRSDAEGGWEVLAGVGGELRILGVRTVEATADGVRIGVDEGEPLTITWIEPDRIATVTPLFAADRFVAPRHRAEFPLVAQADCP